MFIYYLLQLLSLRWQQDLKFEEWCRRHNKQYSPQQRSFRAKVFENNLKIIEQLNAESAAFYQPYDFADLTYQEFAAKYLGLAPPRFTQADLFLPDLAAQIPENWDWRQQGAVTRVRNQQACGSCWAFSTIQNIQGQYFRKTNQLTQLSVQQQIDCDKYNFGCQGGWPHNAMRWLSEHGGLMSERQYPQNDNYHVSCQFDLPKAVARVKSYKNISKDQQDIRRAVYQIGPLSIGLDFSQLQFYRSGVATPRMCSSSPDHALLLVGYGQLKTQRFWIIKNSWGPKWGEDGYLRLQAGKNHCGVRDWVCTAEL